MLNVNHKITYFVIIHLKLSSLLYSTHLLDIFLYELPNKKNFKNKTNLTSNTKSNSEIVVYNFYSISANTRLFLFVNKTNLKTNKKQNALKSINELFLNSNWLEREAGELHGVFFLGKKDTRNLMLQYGDTSAPMKKLSPTTGLREIFYDSVSDTLIQSPVSLQF